MVGTMTRQIKSAHIKRWSVLSNILIRHAISQYLANVRHYEYWSVVLESTIISQHISSIVIFVAVFIYLYFGLLSSHALIYIGTAGTAIGYGFWDWSNTMLTPDSNYKSKRVQGIAMHTRIHRVGKILIIASIYATRKENLQRSSIILPHTARTNPHFEDTDRKDVRGHDLGPDCDPLPCQPGLPRLWQRQPQEHQIPWITLHQRRDLRLSGPGVTVQNKLACFWTHVLCCRVVCPVSYAETPSQGEQKKK